MGTSSNEISLPPPTQEQVPVAPGAVEASIPHAEKAASRAEQAPPVPVAAPPVQSSQKPVQASNAKNNDVTTTALTVVPDVQDDGDLIEKEWVTKAKQIVEANRDDPYKQSEEITVFKADYMQKRYNKTIKVSK